jgi:hypothetical protein
MPSSRDFALVRSDVIGFMSLMRLPGGGGPGDVTEAQVDARRRLGKALDALGGLGSPAGSCVWHVVGLQRSIREWALRQGRAGAAGRCGWNRRKGSSWRRWGCWRGGMGMAKPPDRRRPSVKWVVQAARGLTSALTRSASVAFAVARS